MHGETNARPTRTPRLLRKRGGALFVHIEQRSCSRIFNPRVIEICMSVRKHPCRVLYGLRFDVRHAQAEMAVG